MTRSPCIFRNTLLTLPLVILAACPDGNVWLTTDAEDTSTGADPTTGDASTSTTSTGSTSAATDATTTDAATATTSAEVSACGMPAEECTVIAREWCANLAIICAATPLSPAPGSGGTDYCAILDAQCNSAEASACDQCFYIFNTCKQLGGGGTACNLIREDCLCRAAAHGLPVEN
jgi:hypothetical protein